MKYFLKFVVLGNLITTWERLVKFLLNLLWVDLSIRGVEYLISAINDGTCLLLVRVFLLFYTPEPLYNVYIESASCANF